MIKYHLNLEAKELFDGEIELDESILAAFAKASVVVELVVKQLSSVF